MSIITTDLLSLAVDIDTLNVLENNPRRGDVEAVRRSYETFGQRKPLVARRADRVVIAGNHQLLAARELGWKEIAVVWVDDDEATSNAFVLADNRTADLGTYDEQTLSALLQTFDMDSDLFAATGYVEDDLTDLLIALNRDNRVTATGAEIFGETGERDYAPGYRMATAESYNAALTRMMIVSVPVAQFIWLQDQLTDLGQQWTLNSNAAIVMRAIEQITGSEAPKE